MATFSFPVLNSPEGPYPISLRAPPVDSVYVWDIDEGAVSARSGNDRREGGRWTLLQSLTLPLVSSSRSGSRWGALI